MFVVWRAAGAGEGLLAAINVADKSRRAYNAR